jgi:hypothetical protein
MLFAVKILVTREQSEKEDESLNLPSYHQFNNKSSPFVNKFY